MVPKKFFYKNKKNSGFFIKWKRGGRRWERAWLACLYQKEYAKNNFQFISSNLFYTDCYKKSPQPHIWKKTRKNP